MKKTLKKIEPDVDVIRLQHLLSANGYFAEETPQNGIFEEITHENVMLFQTQHVDIDGIPLVSDGVVGKKTWWALEHPSGDSQRNHLQPVIPEGLTGQRQQLLEFLFEEHAKPVFEVPDGSNKSRDINGYWGNTGLLGLPWCCAFVSWALYETLGFYPMDGKHHVGVQKMWQSARRRGMGSVHPKPGDIFIQIKSGGSGHTGFVIGISSDGQSIYTCEGNCGNRLKIGLRYVSTINHYIDCLKDGQTEVFPPSTFNVASVDAKGTR